MRNFLIPCFNYYDNTSAGLTTFGVRVADKTYSLTSLDLFARSGNTAAGFRTGVGRILAQPGNWVLMAFGDGGVLKSGGANLGNFSSGLSLSYDIGRRFRKDHMYVSLSVRLVDITSQMVKPIWAISFGKTF